MTIRQFAIFLLLIAACAPGRAQVTLTDPSPGAFVDAVRAGGIVQLNFTGVINFTNTIPISTDVTIQGLNRASNVISGGSLNRLFIVERGGILRLRDVSIASGRITPDILTNSLLRVYGGAGIYVDGGMLDATRTTFSSHAITGRNGVVGRDGAGEADDGETAPLVAGAAVFNNGGTLLLTNCFFHSNQIIAGNGGAGGNGLAFGNGSYGGDGGDGGTALGSAVYSLGGVASVSACHFATNSATAGAGAAGGLGTGVLGFHGKTGNPGVAGGAIGQLGGTLSVANSTFEGNRAIGAVGANALAGQSNIEPPDGGAGGTAAGAAIHAHAPLTIVNSTFVRNEVVGGRGGIGGAAAADFFGRNGGKGGRGGAAIGGAVFVPSGQTANIVNSTFHDNILTPGAGGEGGAGSGLNGKRGATGATGIAAGGAIYAEGTASLANSIASFTRNGGNLAGNIQDRGGNLSSDASFALSGPGSMINTDPLLRPLLYRGGFVPTLGLAAGSPARGRAVGSLSPDVDARGFPRGFPGDIGAYEATTIPPSLDIQFAQSNLVTLIIGATGPQLKVETTTNIVNPTWLTLTNVQVTTGGTIEVRTPATNRMQFFRLFAPSDF